MFFIKPYSALVGFALMLTTLSCSTDQHPAKILITGTVGYTGVHSMVLYVVDTLNINPLDSVKLGNKGDFSFTAEIAEPGFFIIKGKKWTSPIFPAFQGDSIELIVENNRNLVIRGGTEAGYYSLFAELLNLSVQHMDSLSALVMDSRHKPDFAGVKSAADSSIRQITGNLRKEAILFIDNHPDFLSNLLIINASPGRIPLFEESTDYEQFFKVDSLLGIYHPTNRHRGFFHSRVENLRKRIEAEKNASQLMKPGSLAPEILLPGTSGKKVGLKKRAGKYTLIYFWAPTNALSRKSNAELKVLYEKYNPSGLSVYAVSFDPVHDRFVRAVNLDKLWWTNVNDPEGMNSEILTDYQITSLPTFVLIDSQGRIIDRFLSVKAFSYWLENNL